MSGGIPNQTKLYETLLKTAQLMQDAAGKLRLEASRVKSAVHHETLVSAATEGLMIVRDTSHAVRSDLLLKYSQPE